MTLGLMFLMGYQFWDGAVHEWAGAGMFLLFLLHHILNGGWYRGIFRGNYPPIRVLQLAVNLLAFLAMLGLMVSGVILSSHVFAFLSIRGGMGFARILHMASAYWGFVGMALHLGLHWGMLAGVVRKALRFRPSRARRILLPILGACVAAWGISAFIRRGLPAYMLVRTHFVFFDFSEPIPLFCLDYLTMLGAFIFIAHYASRLLRKRPAQRAGGHNGKSYAGRWRPCAGKRSGP